MEYQWLGLQDYKTIYQKQRESLQWDDFEERIWGLEHPLVITLGRRAKGLEEVSAPAVAFPVVETDRGGLATLHSPGQLVIYPLLSLNQRGLRPRDYVCKILTITRLCLAEFGVDAKVDESQSGLYINKNKICFVGLRVSQGRVYHGLSLNVNNDLSLFSSIRACGLLQRPMTSLEEEGVFVTPEEVFARWRQVAEPLLEKDRAVSKNLCERFE